ncbi:hypothetical protein Sjap_025391 [Stephania japonica]|uniref:Uncharacterized protein n=1 Tax=Stephania japonica TaxID=461633 RepID=A0AAP0E480_9MAGN
MALLLALLIVYQIVFTTHLCNATDTITHNTILRDGDTIISNGGTFALGFFSPGNSQKRYIGIWYNKVSEQTVVWVANRANPIDISSSGALRVDNRANLVIFNGNQTNPVWSSNVSIPITEKTNSSSLFYRLLDSGNLVLVDENRGSPGFLWQSFDHPTHTMLPGMKIGVDLKLGLNWTLTSWKSPDDPSIGDYSTWVDRSGSPEFFLRRGSHLIWRTGVWNSQQGWSGIPTLESESVLNYSFVNNPDEVSFSYITYNNSIFSRFYLDDLGKIQRLVWRESGRKWDRFWEAPGDRCDNFGECGSFASCNPNDPWICSCLPGFVPKSPKDWNNLDRSHGCVRKRVCDGGDGFLRLMNIKIPNASNARVNMSVSIKDCEGECRKNCSCTGYANVGGNGDGIGLISCLMWFGDLVDIREYVDGGQEFFLRVDAVELANAATTSRLKSALSRKKLVIICVLVAVDCSSSSLLFIIGSRDGYMSPEYALDGLFSIKSDVFSFGTWELWREGKALEMVDPSMGSSYPIKEVMKFIQVGILCVQENAKDRPTMSSVILMLDSETTIPIPKQPAFVFISRLNSPRTSTTGTGSHSISEMSTAIIEGR